MFVWILFPQLQISIDGRNLHQTVTNTAMGLRQPVAFYLAVRFSLTLVATIRHTPWMRTYLRVRVLYAKKLKFKEMLWNQCCSLYYNLLVDIKTVLVWSIRDMLVLLECLMPKNGHFWPKMRNSSRKKNSAPTSLIEQSPNANQLEPKPRATFD